MGRENDRDREEKRETEFQLSGFGPAINRSSISAIPLLAERSCYIKPRLRLRHAYFSPTSSFSLSLARLFYYCLITLFQQPCIDYPQVGPSSRHDALIISQNLDRNTRRDYPRVLRKTIGPPIFMRYLLIVLSILTYTAIEHVLFER